MPWRVRSRVAARARARFVVVAVEVERALWATGRTVVMLGGEEDGPSRRPMTADGWWDAWRTAFW